MSSAPSKTISVIVYFSVALVMLGPISVYAYLYHDEASLYTEEAATTAVAIGAIFRSNSRNLLKSAFMSAIRTAIRTWIRRLVRLAIPILLRVFLPLLHTKRVKAKQEAKQSLPMALSIGVAALWLSFYGVGTLHPTLDSKALFGFSLAVCATIAAGMYLLHITLLWFFSQRQSIPFQVQTSLEGVLLQGYFTGALSYLPLASDISVHGEVDQRARVYLHTLLSLLCGSVFFCLIGQWLEAPLLECIGVHMLLYCFVISFPLSPLDGYGIFAYSKKLWLAVFGMVMVFFLVFMPEFFYGML